MELFLDCLLYYNNVILKQEYDETNNDKNYTFWLKEYLNFNECQYPIITQFGCVKYRYTLDIVYDFVSFLLFLFCVCVRVYCVRWLMWKYSGEWIL